MLGHCTVTTLPNLVSQGHKTQWPSPTHFMLSCLDTTALLSRYACMKWRIEGQPPSGPHTPRQTHIRDQASDIRMAITSESRRWLDVPKIELMKERG